VSRVVGVFAHPDDESLLAGGTLAAFAADGAAVTVVCATRGELEAPGAVREAELRSACAELGVSDVVVLGYPDGELDDAADLAERLRPLLEDADVVVTFGADGLYWHPDHLAVHYAVKAAAPRAAILCATMPEGLVPALVAAAAAAGVEGDLWGLDPESFGVPAESITSSADVRVHLDAKLRALRSHRTQLDGNILEALPREVASRFLGREYFVDGATATAEG
jgi:N-acetyl-1-D-myo-inositol-2-amino-2-deoxy-alpha-D-glucopyranoside deacetylase